MSFVLAAPETLVAAASDVAGIGSTLSTANAAAAAPTTGVLAAGADEVSTQMAALFCAHAQGYQQLSAQVSAFHDRFVQALNAGANTYAAAEANAAQTLLNTVNAPAHTLLGHPLISSGAPATTTGGISSSVVGRVESLLLGNGGTAGLIGTGGSSLLGGSGAAAGHGGASALLLPPTGGANAAIVPAALGAGSIGDVIENLYNAVEPWVQYGVNLTSWAVGWVPFIGILAPQINFFYYLGEPIVQSVLFNTIDFLDGTVTFSQGLSNIGTATAQSINQFVNTEINWVRGFFPPFPPIGAAFPSLPT